ncbi:MAG: head decoration protein [Pseudomonadota bacterium]
MAEELYSSENVTPPSNLFAGDHPALTETGQVASGEGALSAGQVLGQVDRAIGVVAADAGNTGNGTVAGAALGLTAEVGDYQLVCIAAAANGGTFAVYAPDGSRLADASVGVAYAGPIAFTINDGAADFIVGDAFTVPVDQVDGGDWKAYDAAATDGSQYAKGILAADVDTTSAAVVTTVYRTGHFRAAALTGYTAALHEQLAAHNIFVR